MKSAEINSEISIFGILHYVMLVTRSERSAPRKICTIGTDLSTVLATTS